MNLTTSYLGLRLAHPLLPGSSPLADDLDKVRRLEDAGAAAISLRSLFEEQLEKSRSPGETATGRLFAFWPDLYLEQIYRIKQTVKAPLIASLNGCTPGGWLEFAKEIHQAGADALELNVYDVATDPEEPADAVERRVVEMVAAVREAVPLPLAVKLSPYYSSLPHFAAALVRAGADGLVLFNRFYQPDVDIHELAVAPALHLSEPVELRLRLRWLAILSARVPDVSYAATGGVHGAEGAIKAILCGAHAVQMVSALLVHGPEHLKTVRQGLEDWMADHGYNTLDEFRGRMSLRRVEDPRAYERANYLEILKGWAG